MIRHGQASFASANYDRLSDLGRRQATVVGQHFATIGLRFDAIFSGSMERQSLTAQLACAEISGQQPSIQADTAFNEYDADGLFVAYLPRVLREDAELRERHEEIYKSRRLFQQAFQHVTRCWLEGIPPENCQLEPWESFRTRVRDGLDRLNEAHGKDGRVAVFTSGGVIAVGVASALELSPSNTLHVNWGIYNASVTEIKFRRSGPYLMGFNNITHLQLAGDPALITHR
jgi:broad specificity phosphatase PhoE